MIGMLDWRHKGDWIMATKQRRPAEPEGQPPDHPPHESDPAVTRDYAGRFDDMVAALLNPPPPPAADHEDSD